MSELLRLNESWQGYDTFCVTTSNVVREKLHKYGKIFIVGECNRKHMLRIILVVMRCINIILRERPDVVISSGAAPACLLCIIGKMFGAKIVWIDSIANVDRLSLSGRIIRPFASLILTQWPEVAEKYKSVYYEGALI